MVRTESGNRPADLFRLRSLFSESLGGADSTVALPDPSPDRHPSFFVSNPATMVIRAVAAAPLTAASWRPVLGDQERQRIQGGLASSELNEWLAKIALGGGSHGVDQWIYHPQSRSDLIELQWRGYLNDGQSASPEARFTLNVPMFRGMAPRAVHISVDIVFRPVMVANVVVSDKEFNVPARFSRVELGDLFNLFRALLVVFGEVLPTVVDDIVPVDVGPFVGPSIGIRTQSGLTLVDALSTERLRLDPEAQASSGGDLHPLESLNQRDGDDREQQAKEWLRQLLLDSHFQNVDREVSGIVNRPVK